MSKFPRDAALRDVFAALDRLGFHVVRRGNHISLQRQNPDGTTTPMTIPNHRRIKGPTLRSICTQAQIPRTEFLRAFEDR